MTGGDWELTAVSYIALVWHLYVLWDRVQEHSQCLQIALIGRRDLSAKRCQQPALYKLWWKKEPNIWYNRGQ